MPTESKQAHLPYLSWLHVQYKKLSREHDRHRAQQQPTAWANVAAIVDKDAIKASVEDLIDAKCAYRTFAQHNNGRGVYGEKWP